MLSIPALLFILPLSIGVNIDTISLHQNPLISTKSSTYQKKKKKEEEEEEEEETST